MRPREEIARLKRRVEALESQLAALRVQPQDCPSWSPQLTKREHTVMLALTSAYPRLLDIYDLDEIMERRDHAQERNVETVRVVIVHIRAKLGPDVIENVWGRGYRANPAHPALTAMN